MMDWKMDCDLLIAQSIYCIILADRFMNTAGCMNVFVCLFLCVCIGVCVPGGQQHGACCSSLDPGALFQEAIEHGASESMTHIYKDTYTHTHTLVAI